MECNGLMIDPSKMPEGECRDGMLHLAERHDALVKVVHGNQIDLQQNKIDLENITGKTPEEKAASAEAVGKARQVIMYLHSKRFSVTLLMMGVYFLLGILRSMGISPAQMGHFFDALLKIMDKFAQ